MGKRGKEDTPIMDKLEKSRYPSYVKELKKSRFPLLLYEEALKHRETQTSAGGYVSIPGVPAGVLARATKRPEITKDMNLIRVMAPLGFFYNTKTMRKLCRIANEEAIGLLHLHSTGKNLEILDIPMARLSRIVERINKEAGLDVGSTGDDFRRPVECLGPVRCDNALIDTIGIMKYFMSEEGYLDDIQFPRFPHKCKLKISGCPNDCARGSHKADIFIVGVFRDAPRIDQENLSKWVEKGGDIDYICSRCPGDAMTWNGDRLVIDNDSCFHCMYCINRLPGVIRPGKDRGVAVLIGGKSRGKYGPMLPKVLIPFVSPTPPEYREIFDVLDKVVDYWDENAKKKERMGDFIYRVGFDKVLEAAGIEATPQHLKAPRDNVYYHWKKEELGEE
jgi:sulfite reductase alpha subunit